MYTYSTNIPPITIKNRAKDLSAPPVYVTLQRGRCV